MGLNLWAYAVGSTVLAVGVVVNALHTKEQFYPAALYLSKSKACSLVVGNFALVLVLLLGQAMKKLFLGKLREIEIEHLTDKVWGAVMDILLTMTIFRSEFNTVFITWFTILIFFKIFHWLAQDRVDFIQHSPVSALTSLRIFSLMAILSVVDVVVLYRAAVVTMAKGPSMMILFGFEFLILLATVVSTAAKFIINVIDSRQQGTWERKGAIILYLEVITDIFQLLVYLVFFGLIITYYSLPLHIIRNVYLTIRSLKQCVDSLMRYRKATTNMNERFPDVTAAELADTEQICIVCREELTQGKRLPCGHILHFHCLLNWLQRQQTCPICRTSVLDAPAPVPQPQQQQQPQQAQQFNWPPQVQELWDRQVQMAQMAEADAARHGGGEHAGVHQPETHQTTQEPPASMSYAADGAVEQLAATLPEILQGIQVLQIQVQSLQEELALVRDKVDVAEQRASSSGSSSSSPTPAAAREPPRDEGDIERVIDSYASRFGSGLSPNELNDRKALLRRRMKAAVASFKDGY